MLDEYRSYMQVSDMHLFVITLVFMGLGAIMHKRTLPHISPHWIILGIALVVRVGQLQQSLWYDETFTRAVVSLPFDQLHRVILSDVHPPLMYLPQWVSVNILGHTDLALRLPSLLFGMMTIILIMNVAKQWGFNPLWAGLLLAVNAGHVYYSTEARGYALLALLVLVGIWALATKRPTLFVLVGLAPLTHAVGFVYLGLLTIFALWHRWFFVVVVAWVIACLWLPITLFVQAQDVADGFWLGFNGFQTFEYMTTPVRNMPDMMIVLVLPACVALVGYALIRGRYTNIMAAVVWGAPLALVIISIVWQPVFLIRALLPSSQMFVILASPYRHVRVGLLIVGCISILYSFVYDYQKFDIRGMVARCDSPYIYVTSTALTIQAQAYAKPNQQVITYYYPNDLNQQLSWDAREALGFVYAEPTGLHVCIIHQDTPMVTDGQRKHVDRLLMTLPHTKHIIKQTKWANIMVYEVNDE